MCISRLEKKIGVDLHKYTHLYRTVRKYVQTPPHKLKGTYAVIGHEFRGPEGVLLFEDVHLFGLLRRPTIS